MTIISYSEFRNNLAKYLDLLDTGEHVRIGDHKPLKYVLNDVLSTQVREEVRTQVLKPSTQVRDSSTEITKPNTTNTATPRPATPPAYYFKNKAVTSLAGRRRDK